MKAHFKLNLFPHLFYLNPSKTSKFCPLLHSFTNRAMKRNRAELTTTMAANPSTEPTAKPQRRRNEAQSRAPAMAKASQESEQSDSSGVAVKTEPSPVFCAEFVDFVSWEAGEFGSYGWPWNGGIEEDKLLGWFPFVDEDFSRCEEDEGFHDIWQLLHINEIPSSAK